MRLYGASVYEEIIIVRGLNAGLSSSKRKIWILNLKMFGGDHAKTPMECNHMVEEPQSHETSKIEHVRNSTGISHDWILQNGTVFHSLTQLIYPPLFPYGIGGSNDHLWGKVKLRSMISHHFSTSLIASFKNNCPSAFNIL
jgi:hypothetical protein